MRSARTLTSIATTAFIAANQLNAGSVESVTVNGQTTSSTYTARGEIAMVSSATYPVKYEYDTLGLTRFFC